MKNWKKRILAITIAMIMIISIVNRNGFTRTVIANATSEYGLSNPKTTYSTISDNGLSNPVFDTNGNTIWDTIYFGNYWQNDTNGDGVADKNDDKQPIRWRVLSVDSEQALLIADKTLDSQKYNTEKSAEVTWETCTLRAWLNDTFLNDAFTKEEQNMIADTKLVNNDTISIENETEYDEKSDTTTSKEIEYCGNGGNDTVDKIYLLSIDEISEPAYGFNNKNIGHLSCYQTPYVTSGYVASGDISDPYPSSDFLLSCGGECWLRSPGYSRGWSNNYDTDVWQASYVQYYDRLFSDCINRSGEKPSDSKGIRPVLNLKLSPTDSSLWTQGYSINYWGDAYTTTWDCIYFGHYWQNDTNSDGIADKNDAKEAIKWRVLSINGNNAFLLSDQILDLKAYDENVKEFHTDSTWETCSLRTWLNHDFLKTAFSDKEQLAIQTTKIKNSEMPLYSLWGSNHLANVGNDTQDKVYLLSYNEALNSDYGFLPKIRTLPFLQIGYAEYEPSVPSRVATNTNFVHSLNSPWAYYYALRTLGSVSDHIAGTTFSDSICAVSDNNGVISGNEDNMGFGHKFCNPIGIRPVLHLDLSSSVWTYAGTIDTENKAENIPSVTPEPIQPTKQPADSTAPTPTDFPASTKPPQSTNQPKPTATTNPVQTKQPAPTIQPSTITAQTPQLQQVKKVTAKNKKKKAVTLSWKKVKNATWYEIQYSKSKKFTSCKKRIEKKTSVTIKKLKKRKTYYFRIRACKRHENKKVYGKWSVIKKVKTKK